MHLVLERNRALVDKIAHWLEGMELPTAWAVQIVQDFEAGENLRLARAIEDQLSLSKENFNAQHTGVNGLGQVERSIADTLREEICRRMGEHALDDPRIMRRVEQDYGLCFKPSYKQKARMIVDRKVQTAAA